MYKINGDNNTMSIDINQLINELRVMNSQTANDAADVIIDQQQRIDSDSAHLMQQIAAVALLKQKIKFKELN